MESVPFSEQNALISENIETDDKIKLLLSIIFDLEKRLSIAENKIEFLQQTQSNQYLQCGYCQKYKKDAKQKSSNNRNSIISCDECYSKIFFNGTFLSAK
jgi:hypothetical protein